MISTRRLLSNLWLVSAVLAVAAGILVFLCASALGAVTHLHETDITGPAPGGVPEAFGRAWGLSLDTKGDLFVGDPGKAVTDVFDASNGYLEQVGLGILGGEKARSVAVDQKTGDVYVGDSSDGQVIVFKPKGAGPSEGYELLSTWTGANTGPGSFGGGFVYLAFDSSTSAGDGHKGDLYVLTQQERVDIMKPKPPGAEEALEGESVGELTRPEGFQFKFEEEGEPSTNGLAVNSSSGAAAGKVYVADPGRRLVDEFEASGAYAGSINGAEEPPPPGLERFFFPFDVAVEDSTGDVYALNPFRKDIDQFNSAGKYVGQITEVSSSAVGVAVSPTTGHVYVSSLTGEVAVYGPGVIQPEPSLAAAAPVGKTTATLNGTVTPETEEGEYFFEYGPCPTGLASCNEEVVFPLTTAAEHVSAGAPVEVHAPVAGLTPKTAYHYRLVAKALKNGAPSITTAEGQFETLGSVHGVEVCQATPTGTTSATLKAELNPLPGELPVQYHFEYGIATVTEHSTEVKEATEAGTVNAILPSGAEAPLAPHTTYHCRLVAVSEGTFEGQGEEGSFTTEPAAPVIEGLSATPGYIPRTTELLSARINPETSQTSYHFAYIDQAGYEAGYARTLTPEASAGEAPVGTTVGPVQIAGLRAGETYHYELIATNVFGQKETSAEQTFQTASPQLPSVLSVAWDVTSSTTTTLKAVTEPNGLPTTYRLELGTDTNYGTQISGQVPAEAEGLLELPLTNLLPGTTYHWRLVLTNEDGTFIGKDHTFTIPGVPSPITQPIALPLLPIPDIAFPSEPGKQQTELTKAQKLKAALKACRKKHSKKKRAACEKQARRRYGTTKKKG